MATTVFHTKQLLLVTFCDTIAGIVNGDGKNGQEGAGKGQGGREEGTEGKT